MAGAHQVAAGILSSAHQVTGGLTGPGQTEAGGPSLVGHRERFALRRQPLDKLGGARRCGSVAHLAGRAIEQRGRDRACVHVETDERRLTHCGASP